MVFSILVLKLGGYFVREEYMDRLFKIEELEGIDFLLYITDLISREFPSYSLAVSSSIKGIYHIRLGEYSVIVDKQDIENLTSEEDPFGLDRYILGSLMSKGLEVDVEESKYLKSVFSIIVRKESKIEDENMYSKQN